MSINEEMATLQSAYDIRCIVRDANWHTTWSPPAVNKPLHNAVRSHRTPVTHSWNGQVRTYDSYDIWQHHHEFTVWENATDAVFGQDPNATLSTRVPFTLLGWTYPCRPVERLAVHVGIMLNIPHNYTTGFLTYIVKNPHAWTPCADNITAVDNAIQHPDFGESLGNPNIAVVMNAMTQARVVDRSWKPIFRDCFVMIMRVIVISMHHDKIRYTWIPQRAVAELKSRLEFVMMNLGFNKNSGDFMLSLI